MQASSFLRRGVLWLNTAMQAVVGAGGFAFSPHGLFRDVDADPLALVCLRMAASTNLAMAMFAVWILVRIRDVATHRALAAAYATYHALCAVDAGRIAAGAIPVALTPPPLQIVAAHVGMATLLGLSAAWPDRR